MCDKCVESSLPLCKTCYKASKGYLYLDSKKYYSQLEERAFPYKDWEDVELTLEEYCLLTQLQSDFMDIIRSLSPQGCAGIPEDHPILVKYYNTIVKCSNKVGSQMFRKNKTSWKGYYGQLTRYQLSLIKAMGDHYPLREETIKGMCEGSAKAKGMEDYPRNDGVLNALIEKYPQFQHYKDEAEKWAEIGREEYSSYHP